VLYPNSPLERTTGLTRASMATEGELVDEEDGEQEEPAARG